MNLLALDARWQRLNDPDYACPCCGRSFGGLIDIGFGAPDDWPHGEPEPAAVVEAGVDKLSSELCRLDERRFLRAHLALPVRGSDEVVHLAPWAEVTAAEFYAVLDRIAAGETAPREIPATLATALPEPLGGPAEGLLLLAGPEARPGFRPNAGPLAMACADGVSFEAILDLYAACGEDIRPHLTGQA